MRIKRFRDMIRIRTVPPPLSKKYLENLLRECKNRGEFLKKIEKSQGVKIELVDKPPSSYNKIRNRIRFYRGALRANKQSFLAELCHELGHAKARKYFVGDIFMLLIFGITMWRFWLPYDVVATFPFLFLLSLLAVIMYLVGAIRLVKSTAEIRAHIFAAKTLGMDYYFKAKSPPGVKPIIKPTGWHRVCYKVFMPQRLYSRKKWIAVLEKYGFRSPRLFH